MAAELKPCPCGKTPTSLDIAAGETYRYRLVSGACCGEWIIEARVTHGKTHVEQYDECVIAWNGASRADQAGIRQAWRVDV